MIKPIAEPLTEFFKINEIQCLCYKMPYEDGWVSNLPRPATLRSRLSVALNLLLRTRTILVF